MRGVRPTADEPSRRSDEGRPSSCPATGRPSSAVRRRRHACWPSTSSHATGWQVEVLTSCAEDFVTWADVYPAGERDDRRCLGGPVPVRGRAGPVVPSVLGRRCWRRPADAHARRRRALDRPAGPGLARAGRCGRCLRRRRAGLLSVPLLPDGAGHRSGEAPDHPASSGPRRAGPPSSGLPAGVRRCRRAGVPDRGRARAGAGTLPGGLPPPAPPRTRGGRSRTSAR